MNGTARAHPALHERDHHPAGFRWLDADDADNSIYAFLRFSSDGRDVVSCVANFTPVPRDVYRVGLPWAGEWSVLLDTNAVYFGGTGNGGTAHLWADDTPYQGQPASAVLTLPPLAFVWIAVPPPIP